MNPTQQRTMLNKVPLITLAFWDYGGDYGDRDYGDSALICASE
jgi:hypothetical protein